MRNPLQTPCGAIFRNEVLLNSKRVAPYVLMVLFCAHAVLWSVRGAAVTRGWATNSDFNIARNILGFSWILGLPVFTALIMGEPVIRDFRLGIDPLIFSKPISRGAYLLGKFLGNFFVLVCCQSVFVLTLILMQLFHTSQTIVLPARVLPFFKHFFFFLVISHLALAALYFTVGTLTRNAKIVYGLAVCFYPFYAAYSLALKALPQRWRIALDPMLFTWVDLLTSVPGVRRPSQDWVNNLVVSYTSDMIANRAVMILIAAVCLTMLYFRFAIAERSKNVAESSTLNLATEGGRVYYGSEDLQAAAAVRYDKPESHEKVTTRHAPLPAVTRAREGFRTALSKLGAALGVEFRLLRAERSLVVLAPLVIFFSILEVAFYNVVPDVSYSATYASSTGGALLLFLFGVTVFYTGEAMHRDREVRVEPVLWSTPAPNNALLLSKFLATLLLTLSLVVLVGLIAILIQLLRGHTPVEIWAYLVTYSVILLPGVVFMTGVSIALHVLLRDKYLAYAVSVGMGAGLFYLYSIGYNHWLYNPLLYQLWNYADLTGAGGNQPTILMHRVYCLAVASVCLSLTHLFFPRKSTKGFLVGGRLSGAGWSLLSVVVSVATAIVTGWLVISLARGV